MFQEVCFCNVCDKWHAMWFTLFTATSIHSIRKSTKIIKLENNMEGDTKDSTVELKTQFQIQRNRVKKRVWRKIKKGVQKKKLIDALRENNMNTVPEELSSSENIESIPSTFSQQNFKQLEVIQEDVLSESTTLNELVIHKK